jgi:hypothetical protein
MSDHHNRGTKRAKTGEEDKAEAEIFSRPEILKYQNKCLASLLKSEKFQTDRLKKELAKSDNVKSDLLVYSSLLFQQLLQLNDQIAIHDEEGNLRNNEEIMN